MEAVPSAKRTSAACECSTGIDEMGRVHELLSQLRAIVLPSTEAGSSSELVKDLFEDIFASFSIILSKIQACNSHCRADDPNGRDGKKKRRRQDSWTVSTTVPHNDGHEWRKYGQKKINKSRFQKSYYRCANYKGHGCSATKTVLQKDGNHDPPKFEVTYNRQHSCQNSETSLPFVVDSSKTEAISPTENKLEVPSVQFGYQSDSSIPNNMIFTELELEGQISYEPDIWSSVNELLGPNFANYFDETGVLFSKF